MNKTDGKFYGKVTVVTGSSSGIGASAAKAFATEGALVAINYKDNAAGAQSLLKEITDQGGVAITVKADVTSSADVRMMMNQVSKELGPVDILVNNSGSLVERLKLLELTEQKWDVTIDLNLKSAFLCSKEVVASMIERRTGVIINVASLAGRNGGALGANTLQ